MKKHVLFLCTGNSCRSQMAEGLVNHYLGETWLAFSAGTEPSGYVHPMAVEAMAEAGIDISKQRSKSVDEFRAMATSGESDSDPGLDLVVTVCDDAAENCPVWLGPERKMHIGFYDPAQATGSEEERLAVFCRVRDEIREQVIEALEDILEPAGA